MATISYTADNTVSGVRLITWSSMTSTNIDGYPFICAQFADKAVQVSGVFGGATVTLQGSNTAGGSEVWATLNDPQGNTLVFSTAKVEQVLENTYKVRPLVSGGDGTTSLLVVLCVSTPTAACEFIANSP